MNFRLEKIIFEKSFDKNKYSKVISYLEEEYIGDYIEAIEEEPQTSISNLENGLENYFLDKTGNQTEVEIIPLPQYDYYPKGTLNNPQISVTLILKEYIAKEINDHLINQNSKFMIPIEINLRLQNGKEMKGRVLYLSLEKEKGYGEVSPSFEEKYKDGKMRYPGEEDLTPYPLL